MRQNAQWVCGVTLIWMFIVVQFGAGFQAAEKLSFGTAIKLTPAYYLPVLAADEQGLWKKNGLDVEWVPFPASTAMHRAVVAGKIKAGEDTMTSVVTAASRGVPVVVVSDLQLTEGVGIWVPADSRLKKPEDLKGTKVGHARLGSTTHVQALVMVRALGIEKDVKFVAVGGIPESIGAIRAKVVDAALMYVFPVANQFVEGKWRRLVSLDDYLPKKWAGHVVFADKRFLKNNSAAVGNIVKSILQALAFIHRDRAWAVEKMVTTSGYKEETARFIYGQVLKFTQDGRIDPNAVKNVRNFLIEWEIALEEKIPPVDELYTGQFTG